MSIMDMFRNIVTPTPVIPAVPGTPATPGQLPATPVTPAVAGSGDTPAAPNGTAAVNDKAPLDAFAELWKNVPVDPKASGKVPMFNLDPAKLLEAAKTIPFTSAVTPEQQAAITAGGEGATKALQEIMQAVGATTMMHSAVTTGNMVEQAITKARADWMKEVPGLVKSQNLREAVQAENPALSNPAVAPIVTALQSQLQVKYPNASTAELRGMMSTYFDGLAGVIKPAAAVKDQSASAGGNDWTNFLAE